MTQSVQDKIIANPKFRELTTKRNRFSLLLLVAVLAVYYAYIFVSIWAPGVLTASVAGGALTWGWLIGFGVMIVFFITTGIYVRRANGEFDAINVRLIMEARR